VKHPVVISYWTEYESGWGCRPDGASIHLTNEDFVSFCKEYWGKQPTEVPYEYSKEGTPTVIDLDDEVVYNNLRASKNGIFVSQATIREWNKNGNK
jgi:hypothetical protein